MPLINIKADFSILAPLAALKTLAFPRASWALVKALATNQMMNAFGYQNFSTQRGKNQILLVVLRGLTI